MAKPDHGWTNDETWMVASALDNNAKLHEILINEASLALTEALGEGKTGKAAFNVAVSLMIGVLQQRFKNAAAYLDSLIGNKRSKLDKRFVYELNITQHLAVHAIAERVNWREIARHYVSAFME
jgi:hypothetical protein